MQKLRSVILLCSSSTSRRLLGDSSRIIKMGKGPPATKTRLPILSKCRHLQSRNLLSSRFRSSSRIGNSFKWSRRNCFKSLYLSKLRPPELLRAKKPSQKFKSKIESKKRRSPRLRCWATIFKLVRSTSRRQRSRKASLIWKFKAPTASKKRTLSTCQSPRNSSPKVWLRKLEPKRGLTRSSVRRARKVREFSDSRPKVGPNRTNHN